MVELTKNKKYLEKILPHKIPMILIDNVVDYNFNENWLRSFTKIDESSLFYDKNKKGVSSLVGIEYMAQTIGCYAFLKSKQKKPKIGFLLGTRLYNNKIEKFNLGETYITKVKEIYCADDIISFECVIYNNIKCLEDNEVASATVNVYQSQNNDDIMEIMKKVKG